MYPAAQFALDHATEILLLTLLFTQWLDRRRCKCERCMKKRHH